MNKRIPNLTLALVLWTCIGASAKPPARDTATVMHLYQQGKRYFPAQVDSALHLLEQARILADSLHFAQGQAAIFRALSGIEAYRGNFEQSISWIDQGLQLVQTHALPSMLRIDFLINRGVALTRAEQLGNALESYLTAETLARKEGLDEKRGILLNNIGVIYRRLKRYDEATRIYELGISLRTSMADTLGLANTYFNLSATQASAGHFDLAIEASNKARKLYEDLGSEMDLIQTDLALGDILFKTGREKEAFEILVPIATEEKIQLPLHDLVALHTILATYYNRRGQYREAQKHFLQVEDGLASSDLNNLKLDYYRQRSITAQGLSLSRDAYEYLQQYVQLRDSINTQESEEFRRAAEIKYLTQEKDWQLQVQQLKIQKSQRQRGLFALGACSLGLLSLLLWRLNSTRRKANDLLTEKNEIIQTALNEKDILLREIHHRVKNNLQFISSLLGLQTEHIDDPSALDALQEGQDRVQSMALIHQNLYQEDNLTGVDVKGYFIKLIRGLFDSYNIRKDQIGLSLAIDDLNLDVDTVVPIGLIVNELVSNSLKYAFQDRETGEIEVRLHQENDMLKLSVGDNGRGMTEAEREMLGSSFGYRLVKVFQEQLKGELRISSSDGTKVELDIHKFQLV